MIRLEGSKDIPLIIIDDENYKVYVKGSSFPPNAFNVYDPLLEWVNKIPLEGVKQIEFDFFYNYLNSSSKSVLLELFMRLEDLSRRNINIIISWLYYEDDEDMEEIGVEFQEMFSLSFQIIAQQS